MFRNIISILPNKKRQFRIYAFLTIAWMIMIFYFSSQQGSSSSSLSGGVIEWIQRFISIDFIPQEVLQFVVRKSAHFLEYTFLSMIVFQMFAQTTQKAHAGKLAVFISFLYACSDEFHQFFIPGRACMFQDVCIDTLGALVGASIVFVISTYFNRKKA